MRASEIERDEVVSDQCGPVKLSVVRLFQISEVERDEVVSDQ